MLEEILKIQEELNVKVGIEFFGTDIIINRTNFINVPYPIICHDVKSFKTILMNLVKQSQSENVVYIHEEELIEDNRPLAKVIPFKNSKNIDINNPYAYNGYKMKKSDPKELERAVSFINNIRKPIHEQDEKYKSYFIKE